MRPAMETPGEGTQQRDGRGSVQRDGRGSVQRDGWGSVQRNGWGQRAAGRTGQRAAERMGAVCSGTDGGSVQRDGAALVHVPGKDNPSVAGEGYGTQIRLFGAAVFGYQRALAGIGETASQITHGFAGISEVVNEIDIATVKQAVGRDVFGFAAFVVAVVGNQLHDADIADVEPVGY